MHRHQKETVMVDEHNQMDENQKDELAMFNPPSRFLEEIAVDRQFKKEAEERAKKRYEAIAAASPLKRVDPYITEV